MKTPQIIHCVALMALTVVAAQGLSGTIHTLLHPPAAAAVSTVQVSLFIAPLFALVLWGFLLWKIATRPRQWGMGVGIFLLLMILFQTYLFRLAMAHPRPDLTVNQWSTFLLLYELPILIAGVACVLLRFTYPLVRE